jgi:hypothetical protein
MGASLVGRRNSARDRGLPALHRDEGCREHGDMQLAWARLPVGVWARLSVSGRRSRNSRRLAAGEPSPQDVYGREIVKFSREEDAHIIAGSDGVGVDGLTGPMSYCGSRKVSGGV